MATQVSRIQRMIEPSVEALGYECVGVELILQGKHSVLRVYIDRPEGITVDDCEAVSHQVSGLLDVESPIKSEYHLEISSPGLDRPLFTKEHYQRFMGCEVKVTLHTPVEGRRKLRGTICSLSGCDVQFEMDEGSITVSLDNIKKANLVPDIQY